MRKFLALATVLVAAIALPAAASAAVSPGTYTATFDATQAPGSSHVAKSSADPVCVVNTALDVNCNAYVLGGVGHTNATVNLAANYTATVDCFNPGDPSNPNNPIESHTTAFAATSTATVASTKNGQLSVPAQSVSAGQVGQVCPNPNWTPVIRAGTLQLVSFTYTLTFADFTSPYITIAA
jgi:opacity protein-like surface antigen